MRVTIISATYGGASGTGQHVRNLVKGLTAQGIRTSVYTVNNVGYLNIPKLKSFTYGLLTKLRKRETTDLIHIHNPKFAFLIDDKPNVVTVHGDFMIEMYKKYGYLSFPINFIINNMLRHASAITTVNPLIAKSKGWIYIPNMVDLDKIRNIKPVGESYVLFVGRPDIIKGYTLFEKAVKKLKIPYKVFHNSPWKEVISHLKSAYCLVITSMVEVMPTVMLEAWATKCPVISVNIPNLQPFAECLTLTTTDPKNLADCILKVSKPSNEVIDKINKAYELVKNYDMKHVVAKYIRLYKYLLYESIKINKPIIGD